MNNNKKFSFIHGVMKSFIINGVDLVHKRIPKDMLVREDDKRPSLELINMEKAINEGIRDYGYFNATAMIEGANHDFIMKCKDILFTLLASDTAYYFIFEYILKRYCVIKFGKEFGEEKVLDTYEKQAEDLYNIR